MAEPFLSEIRMMSFGFPPKGWALCNGQLLPINQNQALFSLLGTTYGGDGRVNFGLPDLRSRIPLHMGNGHTLGERGGEEMHTLIMSEMPTHTHQLSADGNAANNSIPLGALPANASPTSAYSQGALGAQFVGMNAAMVTNAGGSQSHENRQPYLTISFCIALQGIFPSQT